MNPLSLILTLIQIALETVPLSSTAHVIIAKQLYTTLIDSQAIFTKDLYQLANIPTLLVLGFYFKRRLYSALPIQTTFFGGLEINQAKLQRFIKYLILAVISALITITCYFATKKILTGIVSPPGLIVTLSISACLLLSLKFLPTGNDPKDRFGLFDAAIIGIAQSISLMPGISRLTTTYVAARWLNLDHSFALGYSFLLHSLLNFALITKVICCHWKDLLKLLALGPNFWLLAVIGLGCFISYHLLRLTDSLGQKNKMWQFGLYFPAPILIVILLWAFGS